MTDTILVALGNIRQKYSHVSDHRLVRAENIVAELGTQLGTLKNVRFIHGGKKGTLAVALLRSLPESMQATSVETYLPKLEVDKSALLDDCEQIGAVFEVSLYTEERRERMVADSDLIIVSDGNRGVSALLKLGRLKNKKILPIPFGFETDAEFDAVCKNFTRQLKLQGNHELERQWNVLHSIRATENDIAAAILRLTRAFLEKEIRQAVFVTLPLIEQAHDQIKDVVAVIQQIADTFKFTPIIVKDTNGQKPLIDEIIGGMNDSIAIISILDFNRPNIYFETGYMKGQNKPVLLCCKESWLSQIPFDVKSYELILWNDTEGLRHSLSARLDVLLKEKLITF